MSTAISGLGDTPQHAAPPAEPAAEDAAIHVDLDAAESLEQQVSEQLGVVAPPPAASSDDELFDGKTFEGLKPNVDGEDTDKAKVTLTGGWDIDLEDAAEVAWFNRVLRGQSVDLRIEAECTDRIAPYKRNANTDESTVTGVMKLKVTHVHRLTPEELT